MQKQKQNMFLQKNITHRCSHCYQDEYGSELTFDSLKKILHQYINFYDKNSFCGHIKFTGGEQYCFYSSLLI